MASTFSQRLQEARDIPHWNRRAVLEAVVVILAVSSAVTMMLKLDFGAGGIIAVLATAVAWLGYRAQRDGSGGARSARLEERLAAVVAGTNVGCWEARSGDDNILVSDRWAQMLGQQRDRPAPIPVSDWRGLVHPDDLAGFDRAFDACFRRGDETFQFDCRLWHEAGHWIWAQVRGTVVERSADGAALRVVGTQLDITSRKSMERELADALYRDRLTGLANRTLFMERLRETIERVRSGQQKMFAVLFLDFDRFKVVNDAMGHQAGDELLVHMAGRLRKALRQSGTQRGAANQVARFGGDEFLMLLNDIDSAEGAMHAAERLLRELSRPWSIQGRQVSTPASIGIVSSGQGAEDAETVVRNADLAMYEAKRAGRARAVQFNDVMHTRLARNLMIESSLGQALGTDQLSLVYQPIVDLNTGKRSSVEALVRWNHPALGPISPSEFVPIAEESGLIIALGEWVIRESCAALARWQGIDPVNAPGVVSVNVSRAELAQGSRLLRLVRNALDAAHLPPQSLQLEVTEREVMRDPAASLALMHELRAIGVRLAMDDFGTGTSSLGCLREYPFDVIKVDRAFINALSEGPDRLAVVHATITLVENLGKNSVAEGVETAEQLAILQSLGCHYAQGHFLGMPMAEAQVVETERTMTVPRLRLSG